MITQFHSWCGPISAGIIGGARLLVNARCAREGLCSKLSGGSGQQPRARDAGSRFKNQGPTRLPRAYVGYAEGYAAFFIPSPDPQLSVIARLWSFYFCSLEDVGVRGELGGESAVMPNGNDSEATIFEFAARHGVA